VTFDVEEAVLPVVANLVGERVPILCGVDRVELEEFSRIIGAAGDAFLEAVYTPAERYYCAGRIERLAARFAAKEAATKALGSGIRGVSLREIEVVHTTSGQPRLCLHGRAEARARTIGVEAVSVSLTHTSMVAEAFVVALTKPSVANVQFREEKWQ
jgi:holo-[acyl-carrier protein] synthase